MTCEHEDFAAFVDVARITRSDEDPTIIAFTAMVKIDCANCGVQMQFMGPMVVGDVGDRPAVDPMRTEIRLPIRPIDAPEGFGLERAGFTMRVDADPERRN